jgi:hypothetical protein
MKGLKRWLLPLSLMLGVLIVYYAFIKPPSSSSSPTPTPSASASSSSSPVPVTGKLGRVTVGIFDDGAPMKDRWVVFHEGDGRVVSSVKSGADGKASGEVHEGGMVTVLYGTSVRHLMTITGVEPGDELVVGEKDNDEAEPGETIAKAKVTLPGPHPKATKYAVTLGLGSTEVGDPTAAHPMPVLKRFLLEKKKFPALGLAFDAQGEPAAYAFAWGALDNEPKEGGPTPDVNVRLPAWSTDWREHSFALSNPPTGFTQGRATLGIVSGEDRFERGQREFTLDPQDASSTKPTLRFLVPRPLGETAIHRIELQSASGDRAVVARRVKKLPSETAVDLRKELLPHVANMITHSPSAGRPSLKWTIKGDAGAADATVLQVAWPETREHVWTIVLPPKTKTSFELPSLPDTLKEWKPDGRPVRGAVALIEATEFESYADVRKKGIHLMGEPPEDDDSIVRFSSTGEIVF